MRISTVRDPYEAARQARRDAVLPDRAGMRARLPPLDRDSGGGKIARRLQGAGAVPETPAQGPTALTGAVGWAKARTTRHLDTMVRSMRAVPTTARMIIRVGTARLPRIVC